MFIESPLISLLIFGFPIGIISIVCYFICCIDSVDEPNSEEDLSDSDMDEGEEEQAEEDDRYTQIKAPGDDKAILYKSAKNLIKSNIFSFLYCFLTFRHQHKEKTIADTYFFLYLVK